MYAKVRYGYYNGGTVEGYIHSESHPDDPAAAHSTLDATVADEYRVTLAGGHSIEMTAVHDRVTTRILRNAPTDPNDPSTAPQPHQRRHHKDLRPHMALRKSHQDHLQRQHLHGDSLHRRPEAVFRPQEPRPRRTLDALHP